MGKTADLTGVVIDSNKEGKPHKVIAKKLAVHRELYPNIFIES